MANLADLAVGITADPSGFTSGVDEAVSSVDELEESTSRVAGFVEENFARMGAAAVGIGAGLEGFARSQQEANVGFERMGRVTGEGSEAMRDMATDLQNVTFPMEDVVGLMETATQRGLEGDAIAEYARFWDMVGDATGEAGPKLGEAGVALGLVGIAAGDEAEALDAFGFITDNTTGSIEEFLGFIEKTATELGDATPNINDMAGALGALEDSGLSSRRAQRELRTALSETDGDMVAALETLGISEEAYLAQVEAVEESSGAIEANADAYADSFTPMQKMQAKVESLMTKYGGLADAAGMVSAPLSSVGVAMMGVSKIAPGLVTKIGSVVGAIGTKIAALGAWAAATVAQGARAVASMAVTSAQFVVHYAKMAAASLINAAKMAASWIIAMGPIGWVIAGVVALVALIVANWDTVKEWTKKIWEWVSEKISAVWDWITGVVSGGVSAVVGFFTDLKAKATSIVTGMVDAIVGFFTSLKDKVVAAAVAAKDFVIDAWEALKEGAIGKAIDLVSWVSGLPGRIISALGNVAVLLFDAGKAILTGLWNGLKDVWGNITGWVGGLGSKIADLKGPIQADRKLLIREGEAIMGGLGKGLMTGWAHNERLIGGMSASIGDAFSVTAHAPPVPGVSAVAGATPGQAGGHTTVFVLTWEDFVKKVREAGVDINRLGWQ